MPRSRERPSRNQVDHAGDSVRPVDRRGPVGDDLDPLDAQRRQHRRVGRAAIVRHAMAVDQDQRRVRADAAQVDRVAVGDVARPARLAPRILRDAKVEHLRQLPDRVLDRRAARLGDVGLAERGDRRADGGLDANAAAGDDDVIGRCGARRGGGQDFLRKRGVGEGECCDAGPDSKYGASGARGLVGHRSSPFGSGTSPG